MDRYFKPIDKIPRVTQIALSILIRKRLYDKVIEYQTRWKLTLDEAVNSVYRDFVTAPSVNLTK
jgi:hypothetical protein